MKVRLGAEGFELNAELDKYAGKKVTQFGRHVPRKEKAEAACEIHFSQGERAGVKHSTCAITLAFDDVELKAEETTQHMYSALDIAAVRIEQQLDDYVRLQKQHRIRTRLKRRFHID